MKRIWILALVILLCPCVQAETVTVSWTPNSEGDLAGYKMYYGNQSGLYDEVLNVGFPGLNSEGKEEYEVNVAPNSKYYFVMTAYDTASNESYFSNEARVDFSIPPDAGRWLVTMDDIEGMSKTNYLEPGYLTIWGEGGFSVQADKIAALEFNANLFGNGSCVESLLPLIVGSQELMVDSTQAFFSIADGPLIEFSFADCYVPNESNVNMRISDLTILATVQDSIETIDISTGQIILEWDFIGEFADGSAIDTSQYEIHTSLTYKNDVGLAWEDIAIVAQPDTSYDITPLRDSLAIGTYELQIWPHSHIRGTPALELGTNSFSSEHGWLIEKTSPPVPLLAPRKHQLFRVIIRE